MQAKLDKRSLLRLDIGGQSFGAYDSQLQLQLALPLAYRGQWQLGFARCCCLLLLLILLNETPSAVELVVKGVEGKSNLVEGGLETRAREAKPAKVAEVTLTWQQ